MAEEAVVDMVQETTCKLDRVDHTLPRVCLVL